MTPSSHVIDAVRGELHRTVDRLLDRWPTIAELRSAPDRHRREDLLTDAPDSERMENVIRGQGGHGDPTGSQAFSAASTWQDDLQGAIATLGRLDTDSRRMVGDLAEPPDGCPVCQTSTRGDERHKHGRNYFHAKTCYQRARRAGFKPAQW